MGIWDVIILVASFVLLIAIGVPIAFSIGISSLLTMFMSIIPIPALTTMEQYVLV